MAANTMLALCVILFASSCYCAVDFYERPRNFSIELLYHTQVETGGHVVISPLGIWTLLVGVALGASGHSYDQLARAFILPKNSKTLVQGYSELTSAVMNPPPSSGVSLTSKNYVFLDNDFTLFSQFKNQLQNDFGAAIKVLDFKDPNSARIANNYIETSGGRVSNVLNSNDFQESRMILTNVISFKGLWGSPFNASDTAVEPFYNDQREVIGNVNMMFQKAEFAFSNMKNLLSYVVELPYGTSEKYSMYIVLPYPSRRLEDVMKKFVNVTMTHIVNKVNADTDKFGLEDVYVKLPRFKISTNVVLNKPLSKMGVQDIFQPNLANFQRATKENIFVSAIVHKADIEVTESGTVATAASTATFSDRISPPSFYCNRPFLYFIMEKTTNTVIFSGVYSKPSLY